MNKPITSGSTAKTTATDAATGLLTWPSDTADADRTHLSVTNTGGNDALVSVDGGTVWMVVPAGMNRTWDGIHIDQTVYMKNASAGNNLSGMWAEVW